MSTVSGLVTLTLFIFPSFLSFLLPIDVTWLGGGGWETKSTMSIRNINLRRDQVRKMMGRFDWTCPQYTHTAFPHFHPKSTHSWLSKLLLVRKNIGGEFALPAPLPPGYIYILSFVYICLIIHYLSLLHSLSVVCYFLPSFHFFLFCFGFFFSVSRSFSSESAL